LIYDLRFQPLLALPEYGKAYQYRPEEFPYAEAYAVILAKQNRPEAEQVFLTALRNARVFGSDKTMHLEDVATTLNDLGVLYSKTQRLKEAEEVYTECLAIERQLVKENVPIPFFLTHQLPFHLPHLALALNNLGNVYRDEERPKEAE
jgi:tetratricopeptide (TPR) repeat protein